MKHKMVNIAVLGATGLVGSTMLEILAERKFPAQKVFALASSQSAGEEVLFGNKKLPVEDVEHFDFSQAQIALFSAGAEVSAKYAPIAAAAGCVVIDNTSYFRNDPEIPLVIPEVNPQALAGYKNRNIISNPNCSTIQMLVALKPLYDAVGISEIFVATYQSVSGSGQRGVKELVNQTVELLHGRPVATEVYPQQIAFNLLPHIDEFCENGFTREEMKMIWETRKILDDKEIIVNPTTVRVPVLFGHSEAITIRTKHALSATRAQQLLDSAPGVCLVDDISNAEYPTPCANATGNDGVFVGRVRNGIYDLYTLNLWVVSDNIRKGAALNSVQIAEMLMNYPEF